MYNFKNTQIRFKTNKPYVLKKITMTIIVLGISTYLIATTPLASTIILFLLLVLPMMVKISKQQSEGRGFFGKIANYYRNLYKNYIIEKTPVEINLEEDKISINLKRVELIKNTPVDEIYNIDKNEIAGILYDDIDNDVLIMFSSASINILSSNDNGSKYSKTLKQYDSAICFNIKEHLEFFDKMQEYKYPIELLSEIDDTDIETEDPELIKKEKPVEGVEETIDGVQNDKDTENIADEETGGN